MKIYHMVEELLAFSLTGNGQTDGLLKLMPKVIILPTYKQTKVSVHLFER